LRCGRGAVTVAEGGFRDDLTAFHLDVGSKGRRRAGSRAVTDSLPPEDPRDALIREQAARLEAQAGQIAAQDEQIAGHGERIAALEALVVQLREQLGAALRRLPRQRRYYLKTSSWASAPLRRGWLPWRAR
jgi:hypothetical protein